MKSLEMKKNVKFYFFVQFFLTFFNFRPNILKKISKIWKKFSDFFGSKISCPMKYNF